MVFQPGNGMMSSRVQLIHRPIATGGELDLTPVQMLF